MQEPKPFASLTSGLLARKGAAAPAMRRQAMLGAMPTHDDLGWNDMGEDTTRQSDPAATIGLTPMGGASAPQVHSQAPTPIIENTLVPDEAPLPVVVEERRVLAEKVAAAVPAPKPTASKTVAKAPASRTQQAKAAFTLRLDPDRHLRLRLACAVSNRSAQQIVTEALDAYLLGQPQIDALAEQLPRPVARK